jgi:allophanate hydrolase
VSIFAYNTDDADLVLSVAEGEDEEDGYSRANPYQNQKHSYGERGGALELGVIPKDQLKFFADKDYEQAYFETLEQLKSNDFELIEIDYEPFDEAAKLLYEGPWVSERYIATQPLIDEAPEAMFPVVREIIAEGKAPSATALFQAQYRLSELKGLCDRQLEAVDCMLTPTAGGCFSIEQMQAQPVLHNSQLGYYTNFMNLLDLSAIAVPTAMTAKGLPFGITLVGGAFHDRALLSIAQRIHKDSGLQSGASQFELTYGTSQPVGDTEQIDVVVCGAHLKGLPLNWQLTERGATLKAETRTAPVYRMYALAGGPPERPGLIFDEEQGEAIEVEVWSMPAGQFGSFVDGIPAPLAIGKVHLSDGSKISGFVCEAYGIFGADEITQYGGWRDYLNNK